MKKKKQNDNEEKYLSFDEGPTILSKIAFVFSLLGITSPIGLILSLVEKFTKNYRKKYFANLALFLSLIWLFFIINPFHLLDKYIEPVANVRYKIMDIANIGEKPNRLVMMGIKNVKITIPLEYSALIFTGNVNQSYLDEECKKLRYEKFVQESDGSYTIIMSKDRYKELLQETKDSIDLQTKEFCGGNNIESIEANENANNYTVMTSDNDFDSDNIQQGYRDCLSVLYKDGLIYNLYKGEKCDNIRVDFKSKTDGTVYETWNSKTDLAKLIEHKKVYVLPESDRERGSIGSEPVEGDFSLRRLEISEDSDEKTESVCLYRNGKLYLLGGRQYFPTKFNFAGKEYLVSKDAPEIELQEGDELRLYYTPTDFSIYRLKPQGYCVETFGGTSKVVKGRTLISVWCKNFKIQDSKNVVVENNNLNAGETYTVSWDEEGKHRSVELKADFLKYSKESGYGCSQTQENGYSVLNWNQMGSGIYSIEHSIPIKW